MSPNYNIKSDSDGRFGGIAIARLMSYDLFLKHDKNIYSVREYHVWTF
jgi:hypothetical protein